MKHIVIINADVKEQNLLHTRTFKTETSALRYIEDLCKKHNYAISHASTVADGQRVIYSIIVF